MSSVGAIGNRYDIMINSQSNTAVSSVVAQRPENLSFHNLAISSTGHPPGCSCPVCSGQRSITINTPTAKATNFNVLATAVTHGAGCTCPICSGQRALTIKTNISTNVAKGANFNALVTANHGAGCNCPICSGKRSLSIKTPDNNATSKKSNVSNQLLGGLINSIKTKQALGQENNVSRILLKSDDSPNLKISKNNLSINQDNAVQKVKENIQDAIKNDNNIQQATRSSTQKTITHNVSTINNINAIKSHQSSSSTVANNIQGYSSSTTNTSNNVANSITNTNNNISSSLVGNVTANHSTDIITGGNIASSLNISSIAQNIGGTITLTTALSRAANINIPQDRVFAENIAGRIAVSSGDKPVKLNMMTTLPLNETLVLKGKNTQLILEKENLKMDKIVFGEIKNDKNKANKLPNDLPPMISFNALSNALRSKDINKNNLAKLFMLLTGKFMDEDQITEDLEGMFGVWKDYIKKLREKKERREEKQKNDQEKNKKNKDDENENNQQLSEKIVEVAA